MLPAATHQSASEDFSGYFVLEQVSVPVLGGDGDVEMKPSVYMDHAATSPLLVGVREFADLLERRYRSNVGRSYGFKERVMRLAMTRTRLTALEFFGGKPGSLAVFGSNISQLLAMLIEHVYTAFPQGRFLLSPFAHSAMAVPVRELAPDSWQYLETDGHWGYDLEALEDQLKDQDRPATLLIETVSNLTGYETNWRQVLRLAERYPVRVVMDHAQGAYVTEVRLCDYNCEAYVAVSGHKMGGRDGSGVLVGPAELFQRRPLRPGSGMIFHSTRYENRFMPAPSSLEMGTPNYVAQAALAKSFEFINSIGVGRLRQAVLAKSKHLAQFLTDIPRVKRLSCPVGDQAGSLGAQSFIVYDTAGKEVPSMAVAAALAYFHGVQVRANHHCAAPLLHDLKGIADATAQRVLERAYAARGSSQVGAECDPDTQHMAANSDLLSVLHAVRASVGPSTTAEVIAGFADALEQVVRKEQYRLVKYKYIKSLGFNEYVPLYISDAAKQKLLFPSLEDLV